MDNATKNVQKLNTNLNKLIANQSIIKDITQALIALPI